MKKHSGLTLIELLTVIVIIGILATVAMPSFMQTIKQDRIVSTTNKLMSSYKMARSEAIKRETSVTLNVVEGDDAIWKASYTDDAGETIDLMEFTFNSAKPDVEFELNDLSITALGETASTEISISDDENTIHRCLTIYASGQSVIEEKSCDE